MTQSIFTLILQSVRSLSPNVKHFSFIPADGKIIHFIPGQFIRVTIPSDTDGADSKAVRRSYSIANTGELIDQNRLEFAASYVPQGTASDFLFSMKAGDTIEATGPFGRLILQTAPEHQAAPAPHQEEPIYPKQAGHAAGVGERDSSHRSVLPGREDDRSMHNAPENLIVRDIQRYILVATGTGVTPYRSMLPELARRMASNDLLEVMLLLGVRTPEEALYREEFVEFSNQHPRFQFRIHYSRSERPLFLDYEYSGYVSTAFESIILQPESDIVYLCGNPNMVDDIFKILIAKGFVSRRIRREKYI